MTQKSDNARKKNADQIFLFPFLSPQSLVELFSPLRPLRRPLADVQPFPASADSLTPLYGDATAPEASRVRTPFTGVELLFWLSEAGPGDDDGKERETGARGLVPEGVVAAEAGSGVLLLRAERGAPAAAERLKHTRERENENVRTC